jgi:Tol biopolymer transport system component/secreted PhoX family phosphatase
MRKYILPIAILVGLFCAAAAPAGEIKFTEVPVPTSDLEKRTIMTSQYVTVDDQVVEVGFRTIFRSGDKGLMTRHSHAFGKLIDQNGNALTGEDGSPYISNANDFSSLIIGDHNRLYMLSHFESLPAAIYITQLRQQRDGELISLRTRPLDFSHVGGGWAHCAGSVSPWGSHLGSEEYEPDAATWVTGNPNDISDYNAAMAAYLGIDPTDKAAVQEGMNPYQYGFVVEVDVTDYNNVMIQKHYAMGRAAIELAYVMPNRKTAYISDDGTNVGLYRFEADTEGDLSAGTLYAAKWHQTGADGMGAADISWISLGSATNAQVEAIINAGTTFSNIFDTVDPVNDVCPDGYTSINAGHGGGNHQCLQVKPGMELAASRLETRRYAAMMGATTEWRKMEGITYNTDTGQLYIAMSEIGKGMEDDSAEDIGGPNDIWLTANECGGIYGLTLDKDFVATKMYGVLAGIPVTGDPQNTCDLDGLANPDNLTYIPGYKTLIIGEDTGSGHQNDVIWAYNTESDALTRIQTTPYGSETTSAYVYPDINGWSYIMSVVQHPFGEDPGKDEPHSPAEARGYTGFLGPFPALNKFANPTTYIPPQCYTKALDQNDKVYNSCYTCHTRGIMPNYTYDQEFQEEYAFPEAAEINPWLNLFKDRTHQIFTISDQAIIDYIETSNYFDPDGNISLADKLADVPAEWDVDGDGQWGGFTPDCYFNFDSQGFDKDPADNYTGWRAVAFYPFPSTFWPTNGTFSDAIIRLPEVFRTRNQMPDIEVYKLNLAILEALFKRHDVAINPTDETLYGVDLDKNGTLGEATVVVYDWAPNDGKYMYYVGDAYALQQQDQVKLAAGLFPVGTEFLSTLRYVDVAEDGKVSMSKRLKELRYLKKRKWLTYAELHLIALAEDKEKHDFPDRLEFPYGDRELGLGNSKGWVVQGFIEDAGGQLRPQTVSETMSCIGCHGEMGSTTDSVVSFVRKLDVSAHQKGWFHWNQKGLEGINEPKVAFEAADTQYEYCYYLMYIQAGDEFRSNGEVLDNFFDANGKLIADKARQIHEDVSVLLYPSRDRALALNKIYKSIVEEQSFMQGKVPIIGAALNVFDRIRPEDELTGVTDPVLLTRWTNDVLVKDPSVQGIPVDPDLKTAVDGAGLGGPDGERYTIDWGGLIDESTYYAGSPEGFYFPFASRHTLPTRIIVPNANIPVCYTCHRLDSPMNPGDPQVKAPVPLPPNNDNSQMVQLTSDPGSDTNAAYSPNGQSIAWTSNRSGTYQIYTMNADGSNKQQITAGPAIHGWPQWSPDGTQLVYWGFNETTGQSNISICAADGSNAIDLVTSSAGRMDRPAWRPDGAYIGYAAADAQGNWDIWVITVDGSQSWRLTSDAQMETNPLWSPDGMVIAYKVAPNKAYNLTIENFIKVDNGFDNPEYLEWDSIKSIQMNDWSPDGQYITYTAEVNTNASGEDRISYVALVEDVSMDGPTVSGTPVLLSGGLTLGDRGPRFSPDGSQVVFWAWDQASAATLWLAAADGSHTRRLTTGGFDMYPAWSPDGQTIVFESGRSGNFDIWKMAMD